jgi:ATPase subunit of ABC transporter with duplicated ATPase domains
MLDKAKGIELTTDSHDERFITNTSNQLWVCAEGEVTKYMGDVESYKVRFNH